MLPLLVGQLLNVVEESCNFIIANDPEKISSAPTYLLYKNLNFSSS